MSASALSQIREADILPFFSENELFQENIEQPVTGFLFQRGALFFTQALPVVATRAVELISDQLFDAPGKQQCGIG